ncbi:MAG: tRNA preQ1(34) S-adenosylmethionine ribosyltransferase-isomerase QueA [Pseudomonadota bacterium]|nr:tRNA preQ1(34) S-adenosylmethionine ribosyltransferase-isomerase QueA [Pseudomonadota bacterium]
MRRSDFYYDLPSDLIAQSPAEQRGMSRLLRVDGASGQCEDLSFADFPTQLSAGDLLVLNDTRVFPARFWGRKASGGRVEVLLERVLDNHRVLAQVRASKSPKAGSHLVLEGDLDVRVEGRQEDLFVLHFAGEETVWDLAERHGHIPLPPYIDRPDADLDRSRYQTVFAREAGAVAAPTAGLHFDEAMLDRLRASGVDVAFVTLHVGAGTFQPLRVDDVAAHVMHAEWLRVPPQTCAAIDETKARGGRVVAVGTTVVRALETAAAAGRLAPFEGDTQLFITPGYRFRVVDALLTNFHLPESTLLMLVCAFAGREIVLRAYAHAVAARYRFFSYGDAMLLTPAPDACLGSER